MAEVELIMHKNFLICPTPVRTQTAPGAKDQVWRSGFFIYSESNDVLKNRAGDRICATRGEAREEAIQAAKALIDEGALEKKATKQ